MSLQFVEESGIRVCRLNEKRLWVVSFPSETKKAFKMNVEDE